MTNEDPFGPASASFRVFSSHFPTRFAPLYLQSFFTVIGEKRVDPEAPSAIILPVRKSDHVLFTMDYDQLLQGVCSAFTFEDDVIGVMGSHFDGRTIAIIQKCLEHGRTYSKVSMDQAQSQFIIHGSEFFTEILQFPIAQLHAEVCTHLYSSQQFIEAVDGNVDLLFARPQSASAISAFLHGWVSSRMGIRPRPKGESVNQVIAVV